MRLGISTSLLLLACSAAALEDSGAKICTHPDQDRTLLLRWDRQDNSVHLGGQPTTESARVSWHETGFSYTYNQNTVLCTQENQRCAKRFPTVAKEHYLAEEHHANEPAQLMLTHWIEYQYPANAEPEDAAELREMITRWQATTTRWRCDQEAGFLDILTTEFLWAW